MIHDFLQLLPAEPGTAALVIAIVGTLIGGTLWVAGTKFSRPLITLLTVLVGAFVGMHLPQWCNWKVSGAGPAVGAALVLGISGYVLHRMWVGIGLGAVLAAWVAFVVWMLMHDGRAWSWPGYESTLTPIAYLKLVWSNVPENIARVLPFACGAALVSGVAAAIMWPKLTTVLNWSSVGVSMLAGMGIAAVAFGEPALLKHLPAQLWAQAATLTVLVAIGAAIQWKWSVAPARAGGKRKPVNRNPKSED